MRQMQAHPPFRYNSNDKTEHTPIRSNSIAFASPIRWYAEEMVLEMSLGSGDAQHKAIELSLLICAHGVLFFVIFIFRVVRMFVRKVSRGRAGSAQDGKELPHDYEIFLLNYDTSTCGEKRINCAITAVIINQGLRCTAVYVCTPSIPDQLNPTARLAQSSRTSSTEFNFSFKFSSRHCGREKNTEIPGLDSKRAARHSTSFDMYLTVSRGQSTPFLASFLSPESGNNEQRE
ncbi:hypothetical protein BDQ17DRAFT_1332715 [Cyathus striatus]|nr:hypothetical protein BDQ17DRAFT_1332715 [Cyathus striatus]